MSRDDCTVIRPLLHRIADGEADPVEAMRTARHLPDCTACRILLARERRLAAMLEEELEDSLAVGEDFVRGVMANLPNELPPRPRKKRVARSLKLASIAGLLAGLPALASRAADLAVFRLPTPTLPRIETGGIDGGLEWAIGLGRVLLAAADVLGRHLPVLHSPSIGLGLVAAGALTTAALASVGATTVLALAMHRFTKRT